MVVVRVYIRIFPHRKSDANDTKEREAWQVEEELRVMTLDVYDHLLVDIRIPNNSTKFLKGNLAISVAIVDLDGLVHDLLKLSVF